MAEFAAEMRAEGQHAWREAQRLSVEIKKRDEFSKP